MSKDTFYFSHDYNARTDDKIKQLVREHGMSGYGVFWAIVEDLYNNANALHLDCEGIANDLRVNCDMVKSIINDFDLFVFENGSFGSASIENRLNERNNKSSKARESALCRWNKVKDDANAMRTQCERNAIKERKVKESKESKGKDIIPTLEMVKYYCEKRKNKIDPQYFIDRNTLTGWVYGKNKIKIKDWQATIRTWEKYSSKTKTEFTDEDFK